MHQTKIFGERTRFQNSERVNESDQASERARARFCMCVHDVCRCRWANRSERMNGRRTRAIEWATHPMSFNVDDYTCVQRRSEHRIISPNGKPKSKSNNQPQIVWVCCDRVVIECVPFDTHRMGILNDKNRNQDINVKNSTTMTKTKHKRRKKHEISHP